MTLRFRYVLIFTLVSLVVLGSSASMADEVGDVAMDPPPPVAEKRVFTDVREGSGIDFVHTFGDDEMSNLVEASGVGVCLLDYDGDDLLDVYFVNGSLLPEITSSPGQNGQLPSNRLYKNLGGFRFRDVTDETGTGDTGFGMGCVAGDLDNDGDPDLLVTNYGANRLYRNDGGKEFAEIAAAAGVDDASWSLGAALLDYDGDGLLDVYVGNYVVFDPDYRAFYVADRFPGPLSYAGAPDRFYRNLGDLRFADVTAEAGLRGDEQDEGRAMGVAVADFNNDGRLDIFVANDAMANDLHKNLGGGKFEEVALLAGVAYGERGDATAAMGADFADYNEDGLFDLVVPDMTFNALYQGQEGELYQDVSRHVGLATAVAQFVSWSGHFLDYDNDGHLDLFLTTGDLHDLEPMEDVLMRGDGTGRLVDVSVESGDYFRRPTMGRGAAVGDLDNDGDPDVVLNILAGPPVLLSNDGAPAHWLQVRTVGTVSNRGGIGARVTADGQVREVRAGSGYLSSGDPRVHFGLGDQKTVQKLTVRWPSGRTQTFTDVAADQVLVVEEAE